ncbi:MAG: trypsin-like peptidase domain-containing protein [Balneola sp.]
MRKRDRFLTSVLLILIGVSIGTLIALYTINDDLAPLSEVRYTEINKSESPFFEDEELADIDPRFVFKNIASSVTPSVVYIETIIPVSGSESGESSNFWNRVIPRRARTVGSGVLITKDGYILTNNHVIQDAVDKGIKVVLNDKREYPAKIVGLDPSTDLAVIKISGDDHSAITVGNSESVDVGEWVLAIGNPFRLRSTVTAGIVSALSRDVQIIEDNFRIESFIQTDAAINKGNSGGALVNTSGQLVGINTAIASQSGSYQGYGFAVPINLAIKVATDLIEFGEVRRALLGVSIASVDYDRAVQVGLDEVKGVEIVVITENGAAYNAGLELGDIILEVNKFEVNESNQLQEKIAIVRPGENVELLIWRNGKEFTQNVELKMLEQQQINDLVGIPESETENPDSEIFEFDVDFHEFDLGFRVLEIPSATGGNPQLIISKVYKYSEAWNRGLKKDQTILEVDEIEVEDLQTLKELVAENLTKNGSITLEVIDEDNARGYIELKDN